MGRSHIPRIGGLLAICLALVACQASAGGQAPASAPERVVELTMDGMHFVPDRIEVRQHETVRFLVRNPEDIPHEVFIGTEAEQLEHRAVHASAAPSEQAAIQHYGYGAYVPAFGTSQFVYRFDAATDVVIGCHLPGHWEAGMRATIAVVTD